MPTPDKINNADVGDGRNTGGYRFNQRDNELNDNVTGKMDYNLSPRHAISGTYLWNRDNSDRPDAENDFSLAPKVTNPTHANLVALSWRWTPTAHLTNELRDATTAGDFDRMLLLIDRLTVHDALAGVALRTLADGFEYQQLLDTLPPRGDA